MELRKSKMNGMNLALLAKVLLLIAKLFCSYQFSAERAITLSVKHSTFVRMELQMKVR
jgi:hypothetical protein